MQERGQFHQKKFLGEKAPFTVFKKKRGAVFPELLCDVIARPQG